MSPLAVQPNGVTPPWAQICAWNSPGKANDLVNCNATTSTSAAVRFAQTRELSDTWSSSILLPLPGAPGLKIRVSPVRFRPWPLVVSSDGTRGCENGDHLTMAAVRVFSPGIRPTSEKLILRDKASPRIDANQSELSESVKVRNSIPVLTAPQLSCMSS